MWRFQAGQVGYWTFRVLSQQTNSLFTTPCCTSCVKIDLSDYKDFSLLPYMCVCVCVYVYIYIYIYIYILRQKLAPTTPSHFWNNHRLVGTKCGETHKGHGQETTSRNEWWSECRLKTTLPDMWRVALYSLGSWITRGSILSQVFRYLVNGTPRPPKQNQVETFNLERRRVIKNYYETSQEHVCLLNCEHNETRMLFNASADIHKFYRWRKGRTRGGNMTQGNNCERTLPEGHRAPRDTITSFWSKSSALISEQDEKNSSAYSWNECYDASQITWHIRVTWHKTSAPLRDKGRTCSQQQMYSAKNAQNYAPHYAFFFFTYYCHIFCLQPK